MELALGEAALPGHDFVHEKLQRQSAGLEFIRSSEGTIVLGYEQGYGVKVRWKKRGCVIWVKSLYGR